MRTVVEVMVGALALVAIIAFVLAWVNSMGERDSLAVELRDAQDQVNDMEKALAVAETDAERERTRANRAEGDARRELERTLESKAALEREREKARDSETKSLLIQDELDSERAKVARAARRIHTLTKPFLNTIDSAGGDPNDVDDDTFRGMTTMDALDLAEWMSDMIDTIGNERTMNELQDLTGADFALIMFQWLDAVANDLARGADGDVDW